MRLVGRLVLAAAAALLTGLVLAPSTPAGVHPVVTVPAAGAAPAQQPAPISPPPEWSEWDANGDGDVSIDEYERMGENGQAALRSWVQDLLALYPDGDVREWAGEHFDMLTYFALDIPGSGIAEQLRDAPGAVVGATGDAVRSVGESAAGSALEALANSVGDAAAKLTEHLGGELAEAGRPQLSADFYQESYQRMLGWAGLLMVPLALASIGSAVARGDTSQVGQTVLQIPIAYLLGVLAVSLVSAASGLSVAMARSLVPGVEASSRTIGSRVGDVLTTQPPQMTPGAVLLIGLAIALAALATLLWLFLTEAAVYAVVLFFPLAFAGRVWPATAAWGRRMLTLALALIGARVVIFAVWGLAVDGLAELAEGELPLGTAVGLAALLVMTAMAPLAVLRLVPLVEGAELAGSPGAVAQRALSVVYQASFLARSTRSTGGGRLPVTGNIPGTAPRMPPAPPALGPGTGTDRALGPGPGPESGGNGPGGKGKGGGGGPGATGPGSSGNGGGSPGGSSGRGPGSGRPEGRSGATSSSPGPSTPPAGGGGGGRSGGSPSPGPPGGPGRRPDPGAGRSG